MKNFAAGEGAWNPIESLIDGMDIKVELQCLFYFILTSTLGKGSSLTTIVQIGFSETTNNCTKWSPNQLL